MSALQVVDSSLDAVDDFLGGLEEAASAEIRHRELRRISRLIRGLRRFYSAFLMECYGLRITRFSYREKRLLSRRLVREESILSDGAPRPAARATMDLASMFEDFCDLFHGDLEFGYSNEEEDYVDFHLSEFPRWLSLAREWALAEDHNQIADRIDHTQQEYGRILRDIL